MENKDIRWVQRLDNYSRALKQLRNAVDLANQRDLSDLEEQGLVQAFEYTHELAWKTLKDFLNHKGNNEIYGSKDASRASFSYGLIEEGEVWMDMVRSRNKSSHTYNKDTADEIVQVILSDYYFEFDKLEKKLLDLKSKIDE